MVRICIHFFRLCALNWCAASFAGLDGLAWCVMQLRSGKMDRTRLNRACNRARRWGEALEPPVNGGNVDGLGDAIRHNYAPRSNLVFARKILIKLCRSLAHVSRTIGWWTRKAASFGRWTNVRRADLRWAMRQQIRKHLDLHAIHFNFNWARSSQPPKEIDWRDKKIPKAANFLLTFFSFHLHFFLQKHKQSRKIHRLAPHNRTFTINRLIYGVSVDFIREENPPRRDKRSFLGIFIGPTARERSTRKTVIYESDQKWQKHRKTEIDFRAAPEGQWCRKALRINSRFPSPVASPSDLCAKSCFALWWHVALRQSKPAHCLKDRKLCRKFVHLATPAQSSFISELDFESFPSPGRDTEKSTASASGSESARHFNERQWSNKHLWGEISLIKLVFHL